MNTQIIALSPNFGVDPIIALSPNFGVDPKSGRGDWIRTSDLLLPKQTRYQAALRPVIDEREGYGVFLVICQSA